MKKIGPALVAALVATAAPGPAPIAGDVAVLKVLDYNVWHGRRPEGIWRLAGEDVDRGRRRIAWQIEQVAALAADVLLLQEVNPAGRLSRHYAEALGYDHVHKVTNCGISLGPIKVPANLNEGLAILARPGLELRKLGAVRLSGPGGCLGSQVGFQAAESRFALFAEIRVEARRVLLVNTHLHNAPAVPRGFESAVEDETRRGRLEPVERDAILETLAAARSRALEEARRLVVAIADWRNERRGPAGFDHVIVGGDFNAEPGSAPLATVVAAGFTPVAGGGCVAAPFLPTWDPLRNHVNQAIGTRDAPSLPTFGNARIEELLQEAAGTPRQIDHLLVSEGISSPAIALAIDEERDGLFGSDHFALVATLHLR